MGVDQRDCRLFLELLKVTFRPVVQVAAFLQDELTAACIVRISNELALCCVELAQDSTEAQRTGAFSMLMDNLVTLDEQLLISIVKPINMKLLIPNTPQQLVYAALRAAMDSSDDLILDSVLSCIPSAHTNVLSCLKSFSTLKHLSLACNSITDASFSALVTSLDWMPSLEHLNISDNCLTPNSVATLAARLSSMQHLQHLDISSNEIADEGAIALSRHLHFVSSLSYFNVKDNSITSSGFTALSTTLQHLPSLRCLDVSENSVSLLSDTSARLDDHLQVCSPVHYFQPSHVLWNSPVQAL